jgi:hypothetical protein
MQRLLRDSQFVRVLFGIFLILCSLQLRRFDGYAQGLAEGSCKTLDSVRCEAFGFAFSTLGLGGFWALLMAGGVYYAYVFDWIAPPLRELMRSLTAEVANAVPIVLDQIRRHRLDVAELKALLLAIFENSSRSADPDGKRLGEFIAGLVLYKRDGLVWRRRHSTTIHIEDDLPAPLHARFLLWQEDNSYELVSSREKLPFSLSFFSGTPCDLSEAKTVLANMSLRVRVGGALQTFRGNDPRFQSADFDVTVPWAADGFALLYSEGQLRLSFATATTLANRETPVSISESSLISRDDEDYTKFNHEVVRGVKLYFKLPPSYRFSQSACACCLSAYDLNGGDHKDDVMAFEDGGRTAVLDSDSWMLPGLAFTLGWKPTP